MLRAWACLLCLIDMIIISVTPYFTMPVCCIVILRIFLHNISEGGNMCAKHVANERTTACGDSVERWFSSIAIGACT